ncbi:MULTISPECIES: trypsin-like peptidase domain-containing protein [unclassified Mycolicibacterium]|uniref:trypsin-like peptidase domain-containing protein n=1 Tax=unclassified Mycolicibacterium TaxID=2636767 RepID=UPI002ED7AFEB
MGDSEKPAGASNPGPGSVTPIAAVPAESARGVRIEMVFSADGSTATAQSQFKGMAWGSAFVYEVDGQNYIVTARHNFTGRHWRTGGYLGKIPTEPTHIRYALLPKELATGFPVRQSETNPRYGELSMPLPMYQLPLIGEDWKPVWKQHPDFGPDVDVAVIPFNDIADRALISAWKQPTNDNIEVGVKWPDLGPGQDVFIVGYPDALVTGPMLPLWMRGTIASEPAMGIQEAGDFFPAMLIDARTRKGSSGSAVMRHRADSTFVMKTDGTYGFTIGSHSELVGVYTGRTHKESDLGYVWRIDEVDVICKKGVPGTT